MPHVDSHAPGTFAWVELATTDQNAAKLFYSSLFGWTPMDFPMGPDGVYTMFGLEGRNSGACYTLGADLKAQGVPPHWLLYVEATDVDATLAKVVPAGGKVVAGPFDVMTFGRMGVLQDPTGGTIAVWQSKSHHGTGINGVHGTLCWADLITRDAAAATAFYDAVFGWKVEAGQDGSGYLHIKSGEEYIGGIPPVAHIPAEVPPHWQVYFLVNNCDDATAKAESAGANVYVPPMSMAGVGRWSIVADPQGASLALFEPAQK